MKLFSFLHVVVAVAAVCKVRGHDGKQIIKMIESLQTAKEDVSKKDRPKDEGSKCVASSQKVTTSFSFSYFWQVVTY